MDRDEEKIKRLKECCTLLEKTFNWSCNDEAKALFANAAYAIVTDNPTFSDSEDIFKQYVLEEL